jgi:hypothetical protein
VITHPGNLPPGDAWLRIKELGWQRLDRLPDLQEANPDSIEHQAVGQIATLKVGTDRVDGGLDI